MNPDPANFESLRRLLALKRHEQPPPGYFNAFSSHVIARLRAGETGQEGFWERLFGPTPSFARFWGVLEAKPILGAALGAAFCFLLLLGVIQSGRPDAASANPADPANVLQAAIPISDAQSLLPAAPSSLSFSNGVPSAEPRGSLFTELKQSREMAMPVSWQPGSDATGSGLR
jgi:hypothetical protein